MALDARLAIAMRVLVTAEAVIAEPRDAPVVRNTLGVSRRMAKVAKLAVGAIPVVLQPAPAPLLQQRPGLHGPSAPRRTLAPQSSCRSPRSMRSLRSATLR